MLRGYVNLTYAPPSFNRGRISVTWIGALSGMARLTRRMGSRKPREALLNRLSSSVVSHGLHSRSGLILRGTRSRGSSQTRPVVSRAEDIVHTVKEEDGLVGLGVDMPRLLASDGARGALASDDGSCPQAGQTRCPEPKPGRGRPKQDPSCYHCFMAARDETKLAARRSPALRASGTGLRLCVREDELGSINQNISALCARHRICRVE